MSEPVPADHLFLDAESGKHVWKVKVVGLDQIPRLSDHAAVVVRLKPYKMGLPGLTVESARRHRESAPKTWEILTR